MATTSQAEGSVPLWRKSLMEDTEQLAAEYTSKLLQETTAAIGTGELSVVEKFPLLQPCGKTWLTISEFSVQAARQKIFDFLNLWEYRDPWLHCIDFIRQTTDDVKDIYMFQVRWSLPTKEKPIPDATASVFFNFEVSRVKPGTTPVDVYFSYEASRLVYRPNDGGFNEQLLHNILSNKRQLMALVDF